MTDNPQKTPDDDDDGEGGHDFNWQERLYQVYELIHEQHKGPKNPTEGFSKDNPTNFNDPLLNQDLHPLAQAAYFSGIDNTKDQSVPSENMDPNIRAELKKQLEYKLKLGQELNHTPKMTPKPY
jgi:hypothetical protein